METIPRYVINNERNRREQIMETVPRYIINGEQDNLPLWNVVVTNYFAVITTSVRARSTLDAETLAYNFLVDYYDMNLVSFHTEARKQEEGK